MVSPLNAFSKGALAPRAKRSGIVAPQTAVLWWPSHVDVHPRIGLSGMAIPSATRSPGALREQSPIFPRQDILGFYHLSSFRCSDLGCWVYYENTLPRPPRSEH